MRLAASTATPSPVPSSYPHAACGVRTGYKQPLFGPLKVATAFGQLESDAHGIRYAFAGVDLKTVKGRLVHAAQTGHVTYYKTFATFGKSAVVTTKEHAQTLYTPLEWTRMPRSRAVKAGDAIGPSAGIVLHYEVTNFRGLRGGAASQLNPCGETDGASGTIAVLGSSAAISATFAALTFDGNVIPTPAAGGPITTPYTLTASQVVPTHSATNPEPYEYSPNDGSYYVVLCGNVAFASGNARYAGPFTFTPVTPSPGPSVSPSPTPSASPSSSPSPSPTPTPGLRGVAQSVTPPPLPKLVFFRDAGAQGTSLTAPLPVYGNPCPAPPPPNVSSLSNLVFYWVGQTYWNYWENVGQPAETMAMAAQNASVASVNPNPAPIYTTTPPDPYPYPPPPGNIFTITATGVGQTQVTNTNSVCTCPPSPAAIAITVNATPSPAPVPPPIPN